MTETDRRTDELFRAHKQDIYKLTDRLFGVLLLGQWIFAIVLAFVVSPYAWHGKTHVVNQHVWIALLLGGTITSLPVFLIVTRSGEPITRYVVAVAQMLWSALLIHLSGGRIETHFHVFGSLAFLAFYRDWRVLVPATIVIAADHFVRQNVWPESVFGITNPEWWRFLEHAFWVVFEDTVLITACVVATRDMRQIARSRAEVEDRSGALQAAQESIVRTEKLAAVGQLAASVGHELRNPLAAVRNANTFLTKRLKEEKDPKIGQFLALIDRELGACTKIISDLLDFARERTPNLAPCPLGPLVDEAIGIVPPSAAVTVVNELPADLPIPSLDRDQFRQVIVNLVQNAVEALEGRADGRVVVAGRAIAGGLRLEVRDNGPGIPEETRRKILEPLFTTKTKGTGLGLAIVDGTIRRHRGKLTVETGPQGTTFAIDIPDPVDAASAKEKVA